MAMTFKYKTVKRFDGSEIKAPMIPITLEGRERFETIALLDSGADVSAMPKDIAELLGLTLTNEEKQVYGIGGEIKAIQTKANISLGKGHEHYNFQMPVVVITGSYNFPLILGRTGFFDQFVISFKQAFEKVTLKRESRRI